MMKLSMLVQQQEELNEGLPVISLQVNVIQTESYIDMFLIMVAGITLVSR